MALNKSIQAQHYTSEPALLIDLQNHLHLWSCQLKKQADTFLVNTDSPRYTEPLKKALTRVEVAQDRWHNVNIQQCLRHYRANNKLQKNLSHLLTVHARKKRTTYHNLTTLTQNILPWSSRIAISVMSLTNWCHDTTHPHNRISQLTAIGDVLTLIDNLAKKKVQNKPKPWRLTQRRIQQVHETLIRNFWPLVHALSNQKIVTIPSIKTACPWDNRNNPTTIYLRYNENFALELSINSTKCQRASKLCGTHKDGSIHQVITLQPNNTLTADLHYCVFYHHKKNFPHQDYINPLFRTDNGVMHLPFGGKDLVETIQNHPLDQKTQVHIVLACLLSLNKLHRSHRHHMDIKIDNVLVDLSTDPVTVTIIDIPHNLHAGEKIGYMITAWHSILPKKIPSDKNCPSKRGILNQTGAQIFHDCFAITQIYLMMLQANKKDDPKMEATYQTILRAQKKMISDFHTLAAESTLEQTITRMNQLYNTETLLTYLTTLLELDLASYFHEKLIHEIKQKQSLLSRIE